MNTPIQWEIVQGRNSLGDLLLNELNPCFFFVEKLVVP
jgi:hypothetical protein